ncbi:8304_t:CDS:1 [Scutellospora calospora]|uniref:8304_t:CDS:1 n=1 Tax=Scutellospora calospora TaxID=85575 RepID=A0ACA9JV28_9GLOM|nr:8304_t:CDS:1 [Scutellospora calospora]
MLVNDVLIMIFEYLYDIDVSLFNCVLVSWDWANLAIPILWRDPFKYYDNNNNSLRKVVCHNLDVKDYFYKSDIPIKEYSVLLFPYLEYMKKVNTYHIEKVFKDSVYNIYTMIHAIIGFLFVTSEIINDITIDCCFHNIEDLNKYMKNHCVHLRLYNGCLELNELENLDNLKSLSLTRISFEDNFIFLMKKLENMVNLELINIHNKQLLYDIIKLQNIKFLTLNNSIHDVDKFILIMKEMKNLVYLKIISFDITDDDKKILLNECKKYENIKTLKFEIKKYVL